MKAQRATLSFTLALDEGGGSSGSPAALPPGRKIGAHLVGGWVDPSAGLDGYGKSRCHRDSVPRLSSQWLSRGNDKMIIKFKKHEARQS
jgi:hypothetical protein